MAESLVSSTIIAFSTAPESTYNTNPTTAATFTPMVTKVREQPVPDTERTDDRGVVGRRNAMYPSYQRSGFRIPTAFEISDTVQVGTLAPLVRRYAGKAAAAPTVVEVGKAFRHSFFEADPDVDGLQLPSSSFVYQNNEFDYLITGVCGSTFQVAQTGAQDPQFTLGVVGSGQAKRISIDYPAFGAMALPPQDPYMYGPSSAIQYTDDSAGTISLTSPNHLLRGQTFSANNNLITDDVRQGMPQVDTAEPKRGWYRDFLHFGDREISFEWTMSMDGSYALKNAEETNAVYTNLMWTMKGDLIPTTASANKYEFKIIIPKFHIRTPRTGEENMKRTKTFSAFPVTHAAYYGVYKLELVNGIATAIS